MSIAEKLQTIAENEQRVYDAGRKAEYDAFWDSYQTDKWGSHILWYSYAFAGLRWNDDNFCPKYDIIPSGSANMFAECGIKDLKKRLQELGIKLDTSQTTSTTYMFSNAYTTTIPELDMTNVVALTGLFYGAKVVTIDKLILKADGTNTFSNMFYNAKSLENIQIEGAIGTNGFNVQYSPLSHDSLISIINALQDKIKDTGGTTWTLTLGATNLAKLTDAEKQIAYDKGWVLG